MFRRVTVVAGIVLLLAVVAAAPGETVEKTSKPAKTKDAPVKATAENIAKWVKDMDADDFAVREQAVAGLTRAGKAAVGPVAKAAKGKSLEVTTRAVKVLKNLLGGKDAPAKAAARAALENLAKDENHPAGHMAWQALQPPKGAKQPHDPGRIMIGGNVIHLVGGGARMQMSVKNVNGNKEIDVDENGRKVKITENKDGITVTVTDPPKGDKKSKPKQYKAANVKELKKKHPEAHKLYEKYAQGVAIGNIQIIAGGQVAAARGVAIKAARAAQIDAAMARAAAMKDARAAAAQRGDRGRAARVVRMVKTGKLLDEAKKQLDQAVTRLKAALDAQAKRAPRDEDKLDLPKLIKQIEDARKKLAEARRNLRG